MADKYYKFKTDFVTPYTNAFAITANDSTVFSQPTRALYIGGAGNLKVMLCDKAKANNVVTFMSVPVGEFPIRVQRVYSGNTTATNIVGLY